MTLAFGDQAHLGTFASRFRPMRRRRDHVVAWANQFHSSSLTSWVEVVLSAKTGRLTLPKQQSAPSRRASKSKSLKHGKKRWYAGCRKIVTKNFRHPIAAMQAMANPAHVNTRVVNPHVEIMPGGINQNITTSQSTIVGNVYGRRTY